MRDRGGVQAGVFSSPGWYTDLRRAERRVVDEAMRLFEKAGGPRRNSPGEDAPFHRARRRKLLNACADLRRARNANP
jgi:hypothetical protein